MLAYKGLLNATRPAYPATSCTLQRAAPGEHVAAPARRAASRGWARSPGRQCRRPRPRRPPRCRPRRSEMGWTTRGGRRTCAWGRACDSPPSWRPPARYSAGAALSHSHSCLNHGYAAAYAAAGRICAASVSYGDPASWSLRGAAGLSGPAPRPPAPWRRPTNPPHAGVTRCRWPDGTPAPFAPFSLGPRRQVRPRCRTQTQCSRTRCV